MYKIIHVYAECLDSTDEQTFIIALAYADYAP